MNRIIVIAGLAAAMAIPVLAAPGTASASCEGRKATGTVLGGVGGALIGNSIAHGGGGLLLGGLGGAVVGHEIGASGCRRPRSAAYYRAEPYPQAAQGGAVRYAYYDQYGNPVSEGPATEFATPNAYAGSPACRNEPQSYYDARGALVQRVVQVCAR